MRPSRADSEPHDEGPLASYAFSPASFGAKFKSMDVSVEILAQPLRTPELTSDRILELRSNLSRCLFRLSRSRVWNENA